MTWNITGDFLSRCKGVGVPLIREKYYENGTKSSNITNINLYEYKFRNYDEIDKISKIDKIRAINVEFSSEKKRDLFYDNYQSENPTDGSDNTFGCGGMELLFEWNKNVRSGSVRVKSILALLYEKEAIPLGIIEDIIETLFPEKFNLFLYKIKSDQQKKIFSSAWPTKSGMTLFAKSVPNKTECNFQDTVIITNSVFYKK